MIKHLQVRRPHLQKKRNTSRSFKRVLKKALGKTLLSRYLRERVGFIGRETPILYSGGIVADRSY